MHCFVPLILENFILREKLIHWEKKVKLLLKISIYAGTRKYANSMIREFKKDPQKVYETVLELLGNEETNKASD